MIIRYFLAIIAALGLGCGTTRQLASGPSQEALVDGTFPPRHPRQARPDKEGKCHLPEEWPEMTILVKNGACWVPLDATPEQCTEASKENPYHVLYEGKCWYILPGGEKTRQPTSSTAERLTPVTSR